MASRLLTENGLKARYKLKYNAIKSVQDWMALVRKVDSTQPDGEDYGGAKGVKGPSERKGQNIMHTVPAERFSITNRDWDAGLVIPGKDWRWNKTGDTDFKLTQVAQLMAAHPGELLETLITEADSTTGPDGKNFFATDHVVADTTQSNKLSSGNFVVTAKEWPTTSEWAKMLLTAVTTLMLFKDSEGNKVNLGVRDFSVAVPDDLFPSLLVALGQIFSGSGESNPLKSISKYSFNPILLPEWSDADEFVVAANGQSAFIYQELESPAEPIIFGEGSDYYKMNDEIRMIIRGCYNCGYDRWQGAIHCTVSE